MNKWFYITFQFTCLCILLAGCANFSESRVITVKLSDPITTDQALDIFHEVIAKIGFVEDPPHNGRNNWDISDYSASAGDKKSPDKAYLLLWIDPNEIAFIVRWYGIENDTNALRDAKCIESELQVRTIFSKTTRSTDLFGP